MKLQDKPKCKQNQIFDCLFFSGCMDQAMFVRCVKFQPVKLEQLIDLSWRQSGNVMHFMGKVMLAHPFLTHGGFVWLLCCLDDINRIKFGIAHQKVDPYMWSDHPTQRANAFGTFFLTCWARDKMAANSPTTYSNAFSWMERFAFSFKFH